MDAPVKKELDDIFAYIISCQIPFQDKINYFIFCPLSLFRIDYTFQSYKMNLGASYVILHLQWSDTRGVPQDS